MLLFACPFFRGILDKPPCKTEDLIRSIIIMNVMDEFYDKPRGNYIKLHGHVLIVNCHTPMVPTLGYLLGYLLWVIKYLPKYLGVLGRYTNYPPLEFDYHLLSFRLVQDPQPLES